MIPVQRFYLGLKQQRTGLNKYNNNNHCSMNRDFTQATFIVCLVQCSCMGFTVFKMLQGNSPKKKKNNRLIFFFLFTLNFNGESGSIILCVY